MKLTVLGMNGPYPAAGGACSGYLLSSDSGDTKILLDAGAGTLGPLLGQIELNDLTCVLLSHLHYDHMSDMLPLRYALDFSPRGRLPVYAPAQPENIRALLAGGKFDLITPENGAAGEFYLSFLPAAHPVPGNSIAIEGDGAYLVFTGDTNLHDGLLRFADGCDLLLADAGLTNECWTPGAPHLSAGLCGELARDARAKRLVLTHLSPRFDPETILREARVAYPDAELAERGLTLYI